MADGVSFQIQGLDALVGKLENLKYETKKKGGRFALRKAAQLIVRAAKANAARVDDPETRANIEKNITERWNARLFKRTGDLGFRVGVLGGAGGSKTSNELSGLPGGDSRHWRHLEFGTENMPAQPILRPALANNVNSATDEFVTQYEKVIDRAIKRSIKKGTVI